ncbi:MAG: tautomerase family protein [Rhodospirillum sp.]|nr:tautomerase family protein [Rhodospirillum sp.]MCF8488184.1 tautomerase family protein [Rhodospirillum sp.]
MPIVHFHLVEGAASPDQERCLLEEASRLYADVLSSPMDRVRVLIQTYPPSRVALAGKVQAMGDKGAPYFEFLVLEGRSLDQRQALLAGFTDLLVHLLGVDRGLIRGHCRRVQPEEWAIGGVPAALARADHLRALTGGSQP